MSDSPYPEDAVEIRPIDHGHRYLESYRDRLIHLYADPVNRSLGFERWKVVEIRTYKDEGSNVKHEYLVATLRNKNGVDVLLRIDRRIGDSSTTSKSVDPEPSSSPDASTAESNGQSQAAAREKFSKLACDQIAILDPATFNQNHDQLLVDHTQFADNRHIPLPQLIVLACTINESYHVIYRNCYWFCYTTSEALRALFDYDSIPVAGNSEQGRFHWVQVCPKVNIADVLKKYDKAWESFCGEIERIKNNPDNDLLKKAEQDKQKLSELANTERQRADLLEERLGAEAARSNMLEQRISELAAELASRGGN